MKNVKLACTVGLFLIAFTAQEANAFQQTGTKGYRDFYTDCETSVSGTINGIKIEIETSGSMNNCTPSKGNTCNASPCTSQTVTAIVNKIIK